jgi:predicted regulator of Ras-like GTPase activity (Roadblock/LC7/MglB family)
MQQRATKLQKLLKKLASELPGVLAIGITDNENGLVIAGTREDPEYNIEAAGAYFTDAYLKSRKAVEIVGSDFMRELLILQRIPDSYFANAGEGEFSHRNRRQVQRSTGNGSGNLPELSGQN